MQQGGRVSAAIAVVAEIFVRHRPASEALADWGRANRFAGSGDRAAIGNLVYDAVRQRASFAALMGEDSPRALALAALRHRWGLSVADIDRLCDGAGHAPGPLTDAERAGLTREGAGLPVAVAADIPDWLAPDLAALFGDRLLAEGQALAARAPVDLRVNRLKADRDKVLKALQKFAPEPCRLSPLGIRIPPGAGPARNPHVEAEAAHGKGWFEVQDEGSQIASLLAGARPGQQVIDLCAGAGGKTLALAGEMDNRGQIYVHDIDKHRLRPIFERLTRAGVRNAQVLEPGDQAALEALEARADLVVVDAPCSGSGVWRRKPDSKWRLKPAQLEARLAEQRAVLDQAARLVRPGGRLAYITCSILPAENTGQAAAFLQRHGDFRPEPWGPVWDAKILSAKPQSADGRTDSVLLTPASHGTDGFFIALFTKGT